MKKYLILLLMTIAVFANAQVTQIYVPTDFATYGTTAAGSSLPFYQKNGFLYVVSNKNGLSKIFKINQTTNEITPIQESASFTQNNGIPKYIGEYGSKIFFATSSYSVNILDTSTDTFTINYFSDSAGNPKVVGNYIYGSFGNKNIDTGVIANNTYHNSNNISEYIKLVDIGTIGNNHYAFGYKTTNSTPHYLFKLNPGANPTLLYDSVNKSIANLSASINNNFYSLNGLIFLQINNISFAQNLATVPINGGAINELSSISPHNQVIYKFIYQNKLYYSNNGTPNTILRTDGTTIESTPLSTTQGYHNNFTSWYYPSNIFLEYNGAMYSVKSGPTSNDTSYFVKMDENTETNLLPFTVYKAMKHNNLMYFIGYYKQGVNIYRKLFSYDGTTFKTLDLGNVDAFLNSYSSIYGYGNYLFFANTTSVVKVDLSSVTSTLFDSSTLSTQEISKSTCKVYPNPVKDVLHFSEDLSDIQMIDAGGTQILTVKEKTKTINVDNLPIGNYIITGKDKNGKIVSEKLIKE